MYQFYKKVPKSENNEYGIELLKDENPFEEPSFLSLLALNMQLRHTNGSINRILELSGVRKPNGEENLPLDDIPINFLGLAYSEDKNGMFSKFSSHDNLFKIDDDTRKFVYNYFLPLISNNGLKRDTNECLKNMRNINIMCYCDSIYMINAINQILIEEMRKLAFNEEEINEILSQICIFPIGTEIPSIEAIIPNLKFSTVFFLDIKDSFGIEDEQILRKIFNENYEVLFNTSFIINNHNIDHSKMLLVNDDGKHDLKDFIKKGVAFPSIIIQVVSQILNNSITNHYTDDFTPLETIINENLDRTINSFISSNANGSQEKITSVILKMIKYPSMQELSDNYHISKN